MNGTVTYSSRGWFQAIPIVGKGGVSDSEIIRQGSMPATLDWLIQLLR